MSHEQKARWVLDFVGSHFTADSPADVLDFGCEGGGMLAKLGRHDSVRSLTGIDESEKSIRSARKKLKGCSKPAGFACRVADFPIDRRYEVILAFDVFNRVEASERAKLAALLASRLKLGGYFLLWDEQPALPLEEAEGLLAGGGLSRIESGAADGGQYRLVFRNSDQ